MLSALFLGLAGSLHCVGMCGPLLLALPLDAAGKRAVLRQLLVYHAGRILMYAALGLFFGLVGKALALAGLQRALSLAAGAFMLFMAFAAWRFERWMTALPGLGVLAQRVKTEMSSLLRSQARGGTFALGLLNGLLPCGMVYAALAGAIASTEAWAGAVFMVFFGLGTLPLLLILSVLGRSLGAPLRRRVQVVQPLLLMVVGLLLLQRGLHLDLSLFESAVPPSKVQCH
jgi:sulfite exporter TauE/SafE